MPETAEARWLREHWNPEFLGEYQDKWIAVREIPEEESVDIVADGDDLHQVVEEAEPADEGRAKALYAFVHFGRLQ